MDADVFYLLSSEQENLLRAIAKQSLCELKQPDKFSDDLVIEILDKYTPKAALLNLPKFRARDWLVLCIRKIDKNK